MAVRVTNRNDFLIRDMFDGVPYIFEPGKAISVPIDAANHIFGWFPPFTDEDGKLHEVDRAKMKLHVQRRFGWNTPAMSESGRNDLFYRNLDIVPIMYRMVPVPVEETETDPLDPEPLHTPPKKLGRPAGSNKIVEAAEAALARV